MRTRTTSLRLIRSLRRLTTWYTIRRTANRLEKAEVRLSLLQEELRHQNLLIKELHQLQEQQLHRRLELEPHSLPQLILPETVQPEQVLQLGRLQQVPDPEVTFDLIRREPASPTTTTSSPS